MNNGPDGTGGNGAVGIMGAGLTIINGGTIAGGTGVNGQASAIALTGGTNNYTSSASNAGLTGSISWSSGTTLILNQTTAAGAVSGAFNYSQNNQFTGSGALQITTDGGRAVIIGGSNAGFTGNTTINAGSTLSLAISNALGSGGNAGSISMLAGSTLFLNNISLPNAVNVSGDPNIEVTGINNTMATYTGSSTATTNILGADNNPAADLLRVTTANASYSGTTVVGGSGNFAVTLQGGATNAFGSASTMQVNFGSVLDLGGSDQALASLSGNGTITNSAGGGTNTLTMQGGTSSTFGGGIQDGASATTALTVSNTNTVLTLSGTNTYSGVTTIGGGATLALSGTGSIANSSAVNLATGGIFDVSQTGSGASITTLGNTANGQTGVVALGFRSLTVTNGSSTFAGIIADGGIDNNTGGSFGVSGGTQTLTGQNTYTAATSITGGTLALSGSGSISQSSLVTIGNGSGTATFDISNTSGTSVMGLAGTSDGIVTLGNNTLIVTDAQSGNQFAGAINGSGGLTIFGGAQNLSGSNGYTGQTTINSGASLGLIGSGSIASSIRVLDNGALARRSPRSPAPMPMRTSSSTAARR
jgi:autotransporter-associated beta strand protein